MGNFANNAITESGRVLLADVQAGAVFIPTKIVIGSGNIPAGKTPATMTDVVTVVKNLGINKKERTPDGKCIIGGVYTNEDIVTDFYFRELALYARAEYRDEDGNVTQEVSERLYSYGNAGNTADLMPAYSTSTAVEKQLDLVIWIGNDAEVDLTIESGLYLAHAAKHTEGGEDPITPEMIGALKKTGDTMTGNFFVERAAFPQIILRDTTQQRDGFLQYAEDGLLFIQNIPSNGDGYNRAILILGNEGTSDEELLRIAKIVGGSWQTSKVYHENNKPTPEEIGAINKNGGTITGRLTVMGLTVSEHGEPIEIGQFIDYHLPGSTADYDGRLSISVEKDLYYGLYNQPAKKIIHEGNIGQYVANLAPATVE